MKGLLIKDMYVLTRQMRLFLLLIVVFAVIPNYSMTIFAVVYASMMPYTALAYDERSKWDQLAAMMPYRSRDIVLSKYVLGYLFIFGSSLLSALAAIIESQFIARSVSLLAPLMAMFVGMIVMAITLPMMFKFGVEKGRMLFLVITVVLACCSAGLVSGIIENARGSTDALVSLLTLCLPISAVVVNVISIPLSIQFYQTRKW